MSNLGDLKKIRGTLKYKLTRFANFISSCDDMQVQSDALVCRLKTKKCIIEKTYNEFDDIQCKIEQLLPPEEVEEHYKYRDELEEQYFIAIAKCEEIINSLDFNNATSRLQSGDISASGGEVVVPNVPIALDQIPPSVTSMPTVNQPQVLSLPVAESTNSINSQVRLPTISLPTFSGKFEEWLEFKSKYISMIHNNQSIDHVHKFHYLRACLVGSASQVISLVEFTAENYEVAWESLDKRFSKSGLLTYNHIKSLHELPKVSGVSSLHIRNMIDSANKHLHSLRMLGEPVDSWDTLLLFLFTSKIDMSLASDWEVEKQKLQNVNVINFFNFLEKKVEFLETLLGKSEAKGFISNTNKKSFAIANKHYECFYCSKDHPIFKCPEFLALTYNSKISTIKKLELCENCLLKGHKVNECKRFPCKICKSKHNVLLRCNKKSNTIANCSSKSCMDDALLATAYVNLIDGNGKKHYVRALLDCGATTNFISEELCTLLCLSKQKILTQVSVFGKLQTLSNSKCKIQLQSCQSNFMDYICCYVMTDLTDLLPSSPVDVVGIDIPNHIVLADPNFNIPNKIDIVLGAGIFWKVLCQDFISLNEEGLRLHLTKLGWIIAGPLTIWNSVKVRCNFCKHNNDDLEIQELLERFWKLEEVSMPSKSTSDECELLFQQTTKKAIDGKFVVRYPLCKPVELLSNTKHLALQRFSSLEKRFSKDVIFKQRYIEFINEYIEMGHMSRVEKPLSNTNYMPHHGVLRESSSTTKLRVVFDGSARGESGCSFNDIQHVGPKILTDLFSILLRFRQHKIVIVGDVEKMYRQIWVAEDQRKLQAIFWRESPDDKLDTYQLNTVTYGTTSAPYLAIRCIKELGFTCQSQNRQVSQAILNDIYVDDLLTGGNCVTEVITLANEIYEVLNSAHFKLRKWISNSVDVMKHFKNSPESFSIGCKEDTKVLGISWSCVTDMFSYNIQFDDRLKQNSKRALLSTIAQIYDPLGLIAPVIINAKLLLREVWLLKSDWDDDLPLNIIKSWEAFKSELPKLNILLIPRCILVDEYMSVQLHGFADASELAYGACIYLRSMSKSGDIKTQLLCSKSRVAPLKKQSIPRLELCAALLLAELYVIVSTSLTLLIESSYFWSDSTIVLQWLATSPNLLQTFVGNRVSKIQSMTNDSKWQHVTSANNPADKISRGVKPVNLSFDELWWNGPSWLKFKPDEWPRSAVQYKKQPLELKRSIISYSIHINIVENEVINFNKFSSYRKLLRTVAYVLRFINNCKVQAKNRLINELSTSELSESDICLIRLVQSECFSSIISAIELKQPLCKLLQRLNLQIDRGIIRVGGRINSLTYPYMKRRPVLLPSNHNFTKLIFQYIHVKYFHLATGALLAQVRERYWPLSGRSLARKTVHNCVHCFKSDPRSVVPVMSGLPNSRVECRFPFSIVGIDYGGPILIRDKVGRGSKLHKAYFAIFICFVTKAIHIETVTSLTAECFIAALRRFTSRRGCPKDIYSDNGKNFIGANKELAALTRLLKSEESNISTVLGEQGIQWHFIPPYSPHFGGLWERAIRSVKYYLRRILNNNHFTYEQVSTVLIQIEAILNSRPLCTLSNDPNELEALTPSHFLIGRRLDFVPDVNLNSVPSNRLKIYQTIQHVTQVFWVRWKKEYLSELQIRQKWTKSSGVLRVGDIVIVKEETMPAQWKLGKIERLFPGRDGVARVAELKTNQGTIRRTAIRLCPLPNQDLSCHKLVEESTSLQGREHVGACHSVLASANETMES